MNKSVDMKPRGYAGILGEPEKRNVLYLEGADGIPDEGREVKWEKGHRFRGMKYKQRGATTASKDSKLYATNGSIGCAWGHGPKS